MQKWNKENCYEEAKKYRTKTDFAKNSKGAYDSSKKNGWIDDYTWFERTSYDGCEKFVLKAHPLLSKYQNRESHEEYFYER